MLAYKKCNREPEVEALKPAPTVVGACSMFFLVLEMLRPFIQTLISLKDRVVSAQRRGE